MAKNERNQDLLPENRDDFTKIKGIGQSISQALHEANIFSFADLAKCTPEKLVELLQPRVGFVTLQRITRDNWLGQARDLARQQNLAGIPVPQPEIPLGLETQQPARESGRDPGSEPAHESWRELADFFVSFGESIDTDGKPVKKTRVHYSQTEKNKEWDGIVADELVQWMLGEANLQPSAVSPAIGSSQAGEVSATLEQAPEEREGFHPEISNVWVSLVQMAGAGGTLSSQRGVRVEAQVSFPTDDPLLLAADQPAFVMDILLVNIETNQATFIETPSLPLTPETLPYAFQHDLPVPPPARYQLYLAARVASPRNGYAIEAGPLIRVEG